MAIPILRPLAFRSRLLGTLLLLCSACGLQAEPTPTPAVESTPASSPDWQKLLTAATEAGYEEFSKSSSASPEEYREYLTLLGVIVEMRAVSADAKNATGVLKTQLAATQKAIRDFETPDPTPETGLEMLDNARLNLWQAENWLDALNKIGASRAAQESAAFDRLKREQTRLQTLESDNPNPAPREAWLITLQKARVQAAFEEHATRADRSRWEVDVALQKDRITLARMTVNSLAGRVSFPASVLDAELESNRQSEQSFDAQIESIERQIQKFPSSNPAKSDTDLTKLLADSLQNQLLLMEYHRVVVMFSNQIWQQRHDLWNTNKATLVDQIGRALDDRQIDIQTWQPLVTSLRAKLQERRRQAGLILNASDTPPAAGLRNYVEKAFDQEDATLSRWENSFSTLVELATLAKDDLNTKLKALGLGKNLDLAAASIGIHMGSLWNTELLTLDDSVLVNGQIVQRPSTVTLGMLAVALAILVAGGLASAAFSRWIRGRLKRRFGLEENTATLVQKATHFSLVVIISLVALAVVKIPLTIFALLGGATAIAVGFGAQQLVNNLISGIILLFERPIRIGDLVDVGSFTGTVTAIGSRCSRLRRGDGVEILIPNSAILQSTVVNWTLTDRHAREEILIGIAYGSPVERACEIILGIAQRHPDVLKSPEPEVLFHDFGSDAVVLRLFFWVDKGLLGSGTRVPSQLRLAIYNALNTEGIALAFPQRDIHLDTPRPLSVCLMPEPGRNAPGS